MEFILLEMFKLLLQFSLLLQAGKGKVLAGPSGEGNSAVELWHSGLYGSSMV